uniref:Helitron helicase-like domain-containing protein n=1 Tax=Lactuca sativa TaxID=4236 RepID=A0A9R1UZD4_LACSA|nr:hypothetical protein LSAT_V11C700371220 [Lactuca sativa]
MGNAPYVFRHSGQNYHCMGSLLPIDGSKPNFSQLYIYDTENEVSNRQHAFSTQKKGGKSTSHSLDIEIISFLKVMLDSTNELEEGNKMEEHITYLATASEIAALIVGDIGDTINNRDIIEVYKYINELHPAYLALRYPLLFPYGDDGYRVDMPHKDVDHSNNTKRLLRCESYANLRSVQSHANNDISNFEKLVILPSSFMVGARYMMQTYLDAMSFCKWFGYPYFFIIVTCNPKWPEIKRFLADTTLNPEDRPDILYRLFKIKLDSLIKDLKKKRLLGLIQAGTLYYNDSFIIIFKSTVCLMHIYVYSCTLITNSLPLNILIVSTEIPNKDDDPEFYALVSEFMIHGPCCSANPKYPCMSENKCSKNFPKPFLENTSIDSNGDVMMDLFIENSGVKLDNRSVISYHKTLLKRYQARINVEWCNQATSIKYLFKYINKGPDQATVEVVQNNNGDDNDDAPVDEIKNYYYCRYLSVCEASWRIFGFDVHYKYPLVVRLPFHLPGKQNVVYQANDDTEDVINKQFVSSSMFLS